MRHRDGPSVSGANPTFRPLVLPVFAPGQRIHLIICCQYVIVIPGLDPGIQVVPQARTFGSRDDVDARIKSGHDDIK
ncbi:hypothetical protein CWS72_13525 [Telmatospirillum siberiense]|uniref:Uncharacterized protein n=1 Tax=Telmatospirillum siberiense TaxID=382514 RepID=A0A2N3PUN2_9PROT|nr:hypothetical protein CWS72_13525 [Telmatospirillum siberiense]